MDKKRFHNHLAVAAGVYFLCASVPGPTRAQNSPASQAQQTSQAALPASGQMKGPRQTDIYEGLQFSDEQKPKIEAIHRNVKSRMDAVARNDKLSKDQKEAILEGYGRVENAQIFKVLTPPQQQEVRKRAHALRTAKQQENQKKPIP